MITKLLEQFRKKINDPDEELGVRLLYLIVHCGLLAALIGTIGTALIHSPLISVMSSALVALAAVIIMVLMRRRENVDIITLCMVAGVNLLLLPAIFVTGGGVHSSMNTWFAMGILFCFLLLSGKKLWVMLILSLVADTICFVVNYRHPEWIVPLRSDVAFYVDSYIGMLVLAVVVGMLVRFQREMYEKERNVSRQQQIELEEANKTKSRFLANMSHEIRTPINTIIGLNEMNLREPLSAEVEENCINVQQASRMLLSLINDILDLSKIESGKMEIVPRQYETGAMLSELVNINWLRAHEKKLEFVLDISPEIPSMLYGDDVRIKQVLTNMLSNAIKYTEKGTVTLRAKSEQLGKNHIVLQFAVSDTGIGIRKEDVAFLFDSFRRVDEKKNHAIEGTGLGLSICKQLVDLMGGQIQVDSIYQRGSTFTVTIEQEIVDAAPMGSVSALLKSEKSAKKYRQKFEAPEAKVLIVDDNEMNRMVAQKLLRATRVQVDVAASGAECLAMTRGHFYHVIFMDHMMPEMDGIETLERIRTQEHGLCRETPVIALTANAVSGADAMYREKGFAGYLMKPISGSLLEAMLLKFLPEEVVEYREADEEGETETRLHLLQANTRKRICITTESICDLPEELLQKYDIRCIPYYVETQKGRFCDGGEISGENLVAYVQKMGRNVTLVAPSVEEYETFFADALADAVQVIHITQDCGAGAGCQNARGAARGFDNVHVVDSGQISAGMGLLALRAAQLAEQDKSLEEIQEELADHMKKISTAVLLPKARWQGNTLSLYPVVAMRGGKTVNGSIFGANNEQAYFTYIRRQLRGKKDIDTGILFFVCAGCTQELRKKLLLEVDKYQKFDKIVEKQASTALCVGYGLGVFGLIYEKK